MPGTMSIFAEAWQQKIGGSLTGAESMNALYDAVEKRQLVSADIMPIVAAIMSKKAEPKRDIITKPLVMKDKDLVVLRQTGLLCLSVVVVVRGIRVYLKV